MRQAIALILTSYLCLLWGVTAFQPAPAVSSRFNQVGTRWASQQSPTELKLSDSQDDPNELVAKRIIVKGDIGGYYRSCVLNEAGRFRRLVGTMSPPDGTDKAEIYVEGKRKLVDGFIRWCKRGNVGLSQVVGVQEILEEEPTGLYDDFYVKTK